MPSEIVKVFLDLQSDGQATRPSLEAGRLLAVCQRCPGYPECSDDPGRLAAFLCDANKWCERWEVPADEL